jgi:HEAT repeat protein
MGPSRCADEKEEESVLKNQREKTMAADELTLEQKVAAGVARLTHRDVAKRLQGAAYLGRLGRQAQAAAPALVLLLKDDNVHIRKMAALALGEIGGPVDVVVPALLEAIQDNNPSVCRRAGIAVQELIHANPVALMLVQARLSTATPELRQQIQVALHQVGTSQAA